MFVVFCGRLPNNQKNPAWTGRRWVVRWSQMAVRRISVRKLQRGDGALPSNLCCLLVVQVAARCERQTRGQGCPPGSLWGEKEAGEELGSTRSSKGKGAAAS